MSAADIFAILQGAVVTLSLSCIGILVGLPIGLGLAVLRWARVPVGELVACINAAARQGFFGWAPTGLASSRPRLQLNWEGRPEWRAPPAADAPAVAIQIALGEEQTWRGEPQGAPEWFERLARRIEAMVEVERWTKPRRASIRRRLAT